jgi:hypothetical protein
MNGPYLFYFKKNNYSPITKLISHENRNHFLFGQFVTGGKKRHFWNLNLKKISKAKENGKFIVFDSMLEGFSSVHNQPDISRIYKNCLTYNIDPKQIVYVTSNLLEENNIKTFAKNYNLPNINIISLCFFEYLLFDEIRGYEKNKDLEHAKQKFYEMHKGKILHNLNNRYKQPRSSLAFYLYSSPIKKFCTISHNERYKENDKNELSFFDRPIKQKKKFIKSTPIVIDNNIEMNENFHFSTIFEIVSESITIDWDGTSREYSEKTFKPIIHFQPFLIYGQKGCNHYLKNLGYMTYEDWFDLSFDFIDDQCERLFGLYRAIESVTVELSKMSIKEKNAWRFKNEAVLTHNYQTFFRNAEKIEQDTKTFFKNIIV